MRVWRASTSASARDSVTSTQNCRTSPPGPSDTPSCLTQRTERIVDHGDRAAPAAQGRNQQLIGRFLLRTEKSWRLLGVVAATHLATPCDEGRYRPPNAVGCCDTDQTHHEMTRIRGSPGGVTRGLWAPEDTFTPVVSLGSVTAPASDSTVVSPVPSRTLPGTTTWVARPSHERHSARSQCPDACTQRMRWRVDPKRR